MTCYVETSNTSDRIPITLAEAERLLDEGRAFQVIAQPRLLIIRMGK